MPGHTFRFLHASELLLDEPIELHSSIPELLRDQLEDTSLVAFDRLIDSAIEHDVDFVLLVGNSFVEQSASLRARIALLNGFDLLHAAGIPVFVLPGEQDPTPAWRQIKNLPENVTLISHTDTKPHAVNQNGAVIACITANAAASVPLSTERSNGQPRSDQRFRVMMQTADTGMIWSSQSSIQGVHDRGVDALGVDYLALGGADRKTVKHDQLHVHGPGSLIAQKTRQTGSHGATLMHVAADGALREEFLTLSPLRREFRQIAVSPQTNREQIIQEMQRTLQQATLSAAEEIVVYHWQFRGLGQMFDRLQHSGIESQLLEQVRSTADQINAEVLHQIQFVADLEPAANNGTENEMTAEYLQHLHSLSSDHDPFLKRIGQLADEVQFENPTANAQWKQFTKQIEEEAIVDRCRQIGLQLFARPAA